MAPRIFIYTSKVTSRNRYYGYNNITLRLYEVIDNIPCYMEEIKYRTGSHEAKQLIVKFLEAKNIIDSGIDYWKHDDIFKLIEIE